MRETILASNLIRKLNFMRSVALAICLGLLPSQVFATTQTCETYPDCATMGYTQTSCDDYSISLRCPFDDSKLFCSECDRTYSVKDPNNNVCVDGKTYCANLGQPFDTAAGKCGSCGTHEEFDPTTMKCVHKCVLAGQYKEVPSNHVCTRGKLGSSLLYCYRNCEEMSNCENFTGYMDESTGTTIRSTDKKTTIGISRYGVYYMPYVLKEGSFTYSEALNEADANGGVLPKTEELSNISLIDSKYTSSLKYWTSSPCSNIAGYRYVHGDELCRKETDKVDTSLVILKKCNSE